MKTSIIQQHSLRLITSRAESFPAGARAAFESLEAPLETLRGRRFYGLCDFPPGGEMEYHAGLVPNDEAEEERFTKLGFSIREVAGGSWARLKVRDWTSKTDQFGEMFSMLAEKHGRDPSRPQLEYYRSLEELHLLQPVPAADGDPSV